MTLAADISGGSQAFSQLAQLTAAYYATRTEQLSARGLASSMMFQASMANLNARQAERQAASIIAAGRNQAALTSLQYGAAKGGQRTSLAASGARVSGSALEKLAATEWSKQVDMIQIDVNALAQAEGAQAQAVDFGNQALLSRVSADNIKRSANLLSPWANVLTGLVGMSSSLSSDWQRGTGASAGRMSGAAAGSAIGGGGAAGAFGSGAVSGALSALRRR